MKLQEIIKAENLGDWAQFAAVHQLNPDIFELCLAVDFHTAIGEETFTYAGEKVRIVTPNFFLNDQLFNLVEYFNTGDESVLIEQFNDLSHNILFRDIMSQCSDFNIDVIRRNHYQTGHGMTINIYSAFSKRHFTISIRWDESEGVCRMNLLSLENEMEATNYQEMANFIMKKVKDSYYFNNVHLAVQTLVNCANDRRGLYLDRDRMARMQTLGKVAIGPLVIMSQPSTEGRYLPLILTLNGQVVPEGVNVIYNFNSMDAVEKLINEYYHQYLQYAYYDAMLSMLINNTGAIAEKEQIINDIKRRQMMQDVMSDVAGVVIEIEDESKVPTFRLARKYHRDLQKTRTGTAISTEFTLNRNDREFAPTLKATEALDDVCENENDEEEFFSEAPGVAVKF